MQAPRALVRTLHAALIVSLIFGFLAVLEAPSAQAQTRVNDRDMEALMQNLHDDAKSFQPPFDAAVHKSAIRKTSLEKDARNLSEAFIRQTNDLLKRFKKDRNGQAEFTTVLNTAEQLDDTVHSVQLDPQVIAKWDKIRTEVHRIARAYGISGSFQGVGNRSQGEDRGDDTVSCLRSAGAVEANRLVSQCLQVSPATHPPCNVQNSCALIESEIRRSCAQIGENAPGFCREYR